jgi:hypothetical protein
MRKGNIMKKMAQKIMFCFTSISAEILLQILGYSFNAKRHILVDFCQMKLPLKSSKFICSRAALIYHQKSC